jgi:hypothetical protein
MGQHNVWHEAAQCVGSGQHSVAAWSSAVWWHGAAQCGGIGQHSVAAWGSTVWWHGAWGSTVWRHVAAQCGMEQRSVVGRGSTVWRLGAAQCGGIGQHSAAAQSSTAC